MPGMKIVSSLMRIDLHFKVALHASSFRKATCSVRLPVPFPVPQGYQQIYSARLSVPQGYLLRKDFFSARISVPQGDLLIFSVRPSIHYSVRRSVPSVLSGYLLSLDVWGDSKLPHICIHPAHELIKYISSTLSR